MRLVAYIPASGLAGLGPRPEREDQEHRAIPHHVTLLYVDGLVTRAGTEPDPRIVRWVVRKAVRGCAPGDLFLGGLVELGDETAKEKAVACRVYGLTVHQLRKAIIKGLGSFGILCPQTHDSYIPHLTIAYLPREDTYEGPTPTGNFIARTVRWRLDDGPFATVMIGGKDGNPTTELTASLRSWGRRDALAGVPELAPPADLTLEEGWVVGRAFRIARIGMVFCRDTGTPRLPRPITRDDLAHAVAVSQVHRPGLDVDHCEHEPQGAVLAMALVDGGDAVAVLPAYNGSLAAYVGRCSGALWSSPVLVFETYYHPSTGEAVAPFWIRSVAITPDPATLHDALDPVSLGATPDTAGRWVRGEALAIDPGQERPGGGSDDTADDAGDDAMDELMAMVKGLEGQFAALAEKVDALAAKVDGDGGTAEGETEMGADGEDEGEKMAADAKLTAEVARLRETVRLTERKARIDAALTSGRMKPADRAKWQSSYDRDGGVTFAEVIEAAPAWSAIPQPKGHSVALSVQLSDQTSDDRNKKAVAFQASEKAAGRTVSYSAALSHVAAQD